MSLSKRLISEEYGESEDERLEAIYGRPESEEWPSQQELDDDEGRGGCFPASVDIYAPTKNFWPLDFSCRVCGVQCAIAPDPPVRAICPEHCDDHDYVHDNSRAGKFCQHCDQEEPVDWR